MYLLWYCFYFGLILLYGAVFMMMGLAIIFGWIVWAINDYYSRPGEWG